MKNKPTLVIGASSNEERYSNKAIQLLQSAGHTVYALGRKKEIIHQIESTIELLPIDNVHSVTLYVNPSLQKQYYDYILSLNPKRIIFNPGTENQVFSNIAIQNGIEAVEACTLVMLKTHQY